MSLKTVCFVLFLAFNSGWVSSQAQDGVSLLVLGVAQDAGYPQLNCYKPHCQAGWDDANNRKFATSLAVIDKHSKQKVLFEATPDIRQQMYQLHQQAPDGVFDLAGVFLTHGHMGHYTGLMHMGREAAGTQNVPVYVMPRFKKYLEMNGPWSQLVSLNNIKLMSLQHKQPVKISAQLSITPFKVPHRDEFTETVGYQIKGPNKTALFIPDIDKWQKWEEDIIEAISKVDFALLDATFFANGEIPNRDMAEIPHPFVEESMVLFNDLPADEKNKIIFIHFNHSNPLIEQSSSAAGTVSKNGFRVAYRGMQLDL